MFTGADPVVAGVRPCLCFRRLKPRLAQEQGGGTRRVQEQEVCGAVHMLGAMREQEGRKKGAAPREGRGGGVCLTPPGREALLLLLPLSVFNAHHRYEGLGRRRPLRPPLSGVALVVSGRAGGSSGRKRRVQAMSVSADGSSKGGEAAVASAAATVMEAAFVTIKSIMAGGWGRRGGGWAGRQADKRL